uniref:DUF6589 domain-containing protein n=1 Tax=Amphimedon queenslandica TaxID=400682 RepID=A0A1X7TUB5_AMPQE
MIWSWMYDTKSFMDKGTLCQLRNMINRRNTSAIAAEDCNACEEFFLSVVESHIVTAVMTVLQMNSTDNIPVHPVLTKDLWAKPVESRKQVIEEVTKQIYLCFVDIFAYCDQDDDVDGDDVKRYTMQILSQVLLFMEFVDGIREGDGEKILCCLHYLMLVFKARRRKNYSIEALNLLAQYHFFLPQRQVNQLIWSRCVNIHGLPGRNISSDLYLEHLNKICKQAVSTLGANKTKAALQQVGQCIGVLHSLLSQYDTDKSGKHFRMSLFH